MCIIFPFFLLPKRSPSTWKEFSTQTRQELFARTCILNESISVEGSFSVGLTTFTWRYAGDPQAELGDVVLVVLIHIDVAELVRGAAGEGVAVAAVTVAVDAGRVEEARRHRAHPPLHGERHAIHVHHRLSSLAGLLKGKSKFLFPQVFSPHLVPS